jgi:O-antigen/teichoic acid export membrane protein
MLIGQASINLTANILSALLGLLSVFIFTRLFSPHDYGVYLLGVGFASVISVFLVGWFRNLILSGHARNDGIDVRGLVISGYLICCLTAPMAYVPGGWSDWTRRQRWPRSCSRLRSACSS